MRIPRVRRPPGRRLIACRPMPEVAPVLTIVPGSGTGPGERELIGGAQLLAGLILFSPMTPLSIRSRVLSGSRDSRPTSRVSGPTV